MEAGIGGNYYNWVVSRGVLLGNVFKTNSGV